MKHNNIKVIYGSITIYKGAFDVSTLAAVVNLIASYNCNVGVKSYIEYSDISEKWLYARINLEISPLFVGRSMWALTRDIWRDMLAQFRGLGVKVDKTYLFFQDYNGEIFHLHKFH